MSTKVYTMDEQLKEEKIQTHLCILNKYLEQKDNIEVLDIKDIHDGHSSNRDIKIEVMINGERQTLIIEGKRDGYRKEDTHDKEHMAIEIFAYCRDDVFPFSKRYATGKRIDTDSSVYSVLHKHINEVIDGMADGTHKTGVKFGYGWTKELTHNITEFPVFSYYWHLWKKAGLYRGNKLRDLAMRLFEEKDKRCKFVIALNEGYVSINFLIPSYILREEGCLISLVDFDEETDLPNRNS